MRQKLVVLLQPLGVQRFQRAPDALVHSTQSTCRQRIVNRLLGKHVLEGVLVLPGEAAPGTGYHEVLLLDRHEGRQAGLRDEQRPQQAGGVLAQPAAG